MIIRLNTEKLLYLIIIFILLALIVPGIIYFIFKVILYAVLFFIALFIIGLILIFARYKEKKRETEEKYINPKYKVE